MHLIDKAVDQFVMHLTIAIVNKTKQVDETNLAVETLQFMGPGLRRTWEKCGL
jgi:hypothetical protein